MLTYSHPQVTLALCSESEHAVAAQGWKIDINKESKHKDVGTGVELPGFKS